MKWTICILAVAVLLLPVWSFAGEKNNSIRMEVEFTPSFLRTYPRIMRPVPESHAPGPLLYPEVVSVRGWINFYGPEWFIKQIESKIHIQQKQNGDLADVFICRIRRQTDAGRKVVSNPLKGIRIVQTEKPGKNAYGIQFQLPIRFGGKWKAGKYLLELGIWYKDGKAKKTVGTGLLHCEIRQARKGSDDEINLLTNAWLSRRTWPPTPSGLREKLAVERSLMPLEIPRRILEIDPHDVWARHMLAQYYLRSGIHPDKAVVLYKSILKDVQAGDAHRLIILLHPYRFRRDPPRIPKHWEPLVQQFIHAAETRVRECRQLRQDVVKVLHDQGQAALLDMIRTPEGKTLYTTKEAHRAMWAIRIAGEQRIKAAEPILVAELQKLPVVSVEMQVEICVALSKLHNLKRDVRAQMQIPSRGKKIIRAWRNDRIPASSQPAHGDDNG